MKRLLVLLITLTLLSAMVGCQNEQPVAEQEKNEEPITVGYAQLETTTVWRQAQLKSIEEACIENGFKFIFSDAQSQTAKQVSDIEDLITQGADYIVVSPAEDKGLESALADCKAANIPVLIIDREISAPAGEDYVCYIGADFYNEGRNIGEWLVSETDGKCNVVEIQGTPGSCATGRTEGFLAAIKDSSDIKILSQQNGNWTRADAQKVMENIIQSEGGNIEAVYSHSDEMLYGILIALENAGMKPGTDVLVCSIDGTKTMVQKIIDGEVNADYLCSPFFGPKVVEVINSLISGDEVETNILNPGFLFDKNNAADNLDKAC